MRDAFVKGFMGELDKIAAAKGGMKPGHPFRSVVEQAKAHAGVKKGMSPAAAKQRVPIMRKLIDKGWRSSKEQASKK